MFVNTYLASPKVLSWALCVLIVHHPLSLIIGKHKGIKFHFYADNSQVYMHLSQKNTSAAFEQLNRYFAPYHSSYSSCYSTKHSQSGGNFLVIPKYYPSVHKSFKQFGNNFAFDAPTVWNALADEIHASPLRSLFQKVA